MASSSQPDSIAPGGTEDESRRDVLAIICPVCGGPTVQVKCKVICSSEICRGRVIMNCAEF